jgi:hypothetical protein
MTTLIEAARQALEALITAEAGLADIGDADREPGDDLAWCEARAAQALSAPRSAITSLRQAIEQAEKQEPIAWIERDMMCDEFDPDSVTCEKPDTATDGWEWVTLVLSTPSIAQREWVGLTDEEIDDLVKNTRGHELIKATEVKLKEKNT